MLFKPKELALVLIQIFEIILLCPLVCSLCPLVCSDVGRNQLVEMKWFLLTFYSYSSYFLTKKKEFFCHYFFRKMDAVIEVGWACQTPCQTPVLVAMIVVSSWWPRFPKQQRGLTMLSHLIQSSYHNPKYLILDKKPIYPRIISHPAKNSLSFLIKYTRLYQCKSLMGWVLKSPC